MTAVSAAPRRSAREWLLAMPEVFSVGELALVMGCPRTEASQYLWRWRDKTMVRGLGGKSGIFIILFRTQRSDGQRPLGAGAAEGHAVLDDRRTRPWPAAG